MSADPVHREVQISLAAFPGMRHLEAAHLAIGSSLERTLAEPLFGEIGCAHVQLVPQNYGRLDEALCEQLVAAFPATHFRLHANVRVGSTHTIADASGFEQHREWFETAARISKLLDAPAYSCHSGSRAESDMATMLDNARRLADLFGCPVVSGGLKARKNGD